MGEPVRLDLVEYGHASLELQPETVEHLSRHFSDAVTLSPRGGRKFHLEANARIGTIVAPELEIRIRPKVPLRSLLYMLGHAYRLGKYRRETIDQLERPDIRELLIVIFAGQVEDLVRRGLRQGYCEEEDELQFLRGRVMVDQMIRRVPGRSLRTPCRYEEYSPNLIHNQILRYTLEQLPVVMDANLVTRLQRLRHLLGELRWRTFRIPEIRSVSYDRLTEHYRPLHALCELLLSARGLEHEAGGYPMGSFLVDMNDLFEAFVARWFEDHLPRPYAVLTQHRTYLDRGRAIAIRPDLVVTRRGAACLVADTKYKRLKTSGPGNHDAYQVLAYCRVLGVRTGVLLYPTPAKNGRYVVRDGENLIQTDGPGLSGEPVDVAREMGALVDRVVGLTG
ncbi:MAG: hypothetical protein R3E97_00015 [Candidatus Eisenbacteria bacterium]